MAIVVPLIYINGEYTVSPKNPQIASQDNSTHLSGIDGHCPGVSHVTLIFFFPVHGS